MSEPLRDLHDKLTAGFAAALKVAPVDVKVVVA